MSICTGAYLLAAAGVLDSRRATTHWEYCDSLAATYGNVQVESDPVFIRDGDVWTSAGITAGIDLTLALVEDDLGPDVTLAVARQLVVFLKRPGGQSQFSSALSAQQAARPELRELQARIVGHLDEHLSVGALADRAIMSERSFARAFRREVGQTPAAYVEALRIEHARALLETGAPSLNGVARSAGFASAEVLRRAFHRHIGVSPADYRERFGPATSPYKLLARRPALPRRNSLSVSPSKLLDRCDCLGDDSSRFRCPDLTRRRDLPIQSTLAFSAAHNRRRVSGGVAVLGRPAGRPRAGRRGPGQGQAQHGPGSTVRLIFCGSRIPVSCPVTRPGVARAPAIVSSEMDCLSINSVAVLSGPGPWDPGVVSRES